MTPAEAIALAIAHHQAGRLAAAEQIYRQVLAVEPENVDALHLLGVIAHQAGQHERSVEYIGRAIQLKGNEGPFYSNLGNAWTALGRHDEALACYRRAVELLPEFADGYNNLGAAYRALGQPAAALACFRRAVELQPNHGEARTSLAAAYIESGRLEEALACCRGTVEFYPALPESHNNLGTVLQALGRLEEALACYRRAVELNPQYAEAHNNVGAALQALGRFDESVLADYRRAIALNPRLPDAHNNLGAALRALGDVEEAAACFRRALELAPQHALALSNLGSALQGLGQPQEAIPCFRRALALKPDFTGALDNELLARQYGPEARLEDLAAAHAEYQQRFAAPLRATWQPHPNDRDPLRRLRVGFVSPDFGQHPVGYFLVRCLENLNASACETVLYSDRLEHDELTARLQTAAGAWRPTKHVSDPALCELIRGDRIDILFDLAGHTAGNRLLAFARKPAPIQVTWAGYVGTTGLEAMDYILADRYEIPAESEAHYCEHVLRMPDGYVCFDPPREAPPVATLPALERGEVTFGSLNNPAKVTLSVVETWAEILRRVPRSRLALSTRGTRNPSIAARLAGLFAQRGIAAGRVVFCDAGPRAQFMGHYHHIDIALDPFPYNGGLTTCEALWMGVPVVTFPGPTFAGRHSLSHLSNAGCTETIAADRGQYIELAVTLAQDLPRLAALRAGLRPRMAASRLCDGPCFAANFLHMLRGIWQRWVEQGNG